MKMLYEIYQAGFIIYCATAVINGYYAVVSAIHLNMNDCRDKEPPQHLMAEM